MPGLRATFARNAMSDGIVVSSPETPRFIVFGLRPQRARRVELRLSSQPRLSAVIGAEFLEQSG